MCYTVALLSYKSTDFIFRNFPPVFICCFLNRNIFFLIAKPHGMEAVLYREQLSNYQGTIAPFTWTVFLDLRKA